MNSRQENRSKLSFTARIITTCRSPSWAPATCKYSLELLLSICGEIKSKGFLKFYKLIICGAAAAGANDNNNDNNGNNININNSEALACEARAAEHLQ